MATVWKLPIPVLRGILLVLALCHSCLTVGGTTQTQEQRKGRRLGVPVFSAERLSKDD